MGMGKGLLALECDLLYRQADSSLYSFHVLRIIRNRGPVCVGFVFKGYN
jgi:hypothetical protein